MTNSSEKKVIRLGVMPPLTGLVNLYGQEISWAAKVACDEINEQGGVLGHKLELVIKDDGSMPQTSVEAAEKLIDEHGCVAIIGNLLSNSRIAVANTVAAPRRIPYLNFSFYEGSIFNRYFFHFAALPNQQIDKMIPWMTDRYGPKMYFAGNNYEWPRGSIDAAKRALVNHGGEVVGEEYFDIGVEDFSEVIERVEKSGADVFVPYAAGQDQINLLNLFYECGLKERMAVVMGHYDEAMVANLRPEVREGLYSSNTYFMGIDNEVNHQYLKRLASLPDVNGIWPKGNGVLTNFGEGTWLCVHAFARAAQVAGTFESEALVDALETVVVNAPQGIVVMDPVTHHAKVNTWLSRCRRDGSFEVVQSFGLNEPQIPRRYRQSSGDIKAKPKKPGVAQTQSDWQLITVVPYLITKNDIDHTEVNLFNSYTTNVEFATDLLQQLVSDPAWLEALARTGEPGETDIKNGSATLKVRLTPLYTEGVCSHFALHIMAEKPALQDNDVSILMHRAMPGQDNSLAVLITDMNGIITYVNNVVLDMWRIESANLMVGRHVNEFIHLSDNQSVRFIDEIATNDCHYQAKHPDGSLFKVEVAIDPIKGRNENQVGCILSCHLVKDNGHTVNDNLISADIIKAVDSAIVAIDEFSRIISVNSAATEMFLYEEQEMLGMPLEQLIPPHLRKIHNSYVREFLDSPDLLRAMGNRSEITGYRSDGTFFPSEISISKFKSHGNWIMVATIRDISEMRKNAEELIRHATHDPLTSLPNRMLIHDRINSALSRSERSGKSVALMFVDLDDFKLVNDTYGHEVGDQLLIAISSELLKIVRPGDTVARFGGDEFVVMCDQLTDWGIITELAERIVDRLKHPLTIAGHEFFATASIGVAIGHGLTHSADELLRNADAAMYKAKERGRDGWMIFNDEMGENSRRQLKIATGLRSALKNNELYTVLQPVVNSANGEIIGAETLLRWNKDNEEISPASFIPVAEMTGTIMAIGEWVFREACLIQRQWAESLGDVSAPYISVNLSARQLNEPDLVHRFTTVLRETRANPNKIVLEITESTLMKDVEYTIRILNELGRLGMSLAVDDFGTGYSSLSQLKRLPVDTLKVDRIFVDKIDQHNDTRSITSAIVNMAHSLALNVTAEGAETREEVETLRSLGCDTIQGYYFYKPMRIGELNHLLLEQNALKVGSF